jgi:ornithine cyclodeaminase/alanine dehydrogenase-like protein (mu-crystallin family)
MHEIPLISDDFINDKTDFPQLIARLEKAFAADSIMVPLRHHHDFPNPQEVSESSLLLMPAWDPGKIAGVKVVTVSPENAKYHLPSIQGIYLYFDAHKGNIKAIFDAKALTNKRTAAASALASAYLSREDSKSLLMIGTGALSVNLIRAHASVRPLEDIYIYGRNAQKALAVAEELRDEVFSVSVVEKISQVASQVDIISCATLSTKPLVLGEYLVAGQHLDMVGAYKKNMREADDDALLKSTLYVDNFTGALKETGDLVIPLKTGVISEQDIKADLFSLCGGNASGRRDSSEITFFKSVGHALEDLVAANYYFEQLS